VLTLAIETSGRTGAAALARDGTCLEERQLRQAGRRHAQTLVAEIDELLISHGFAPRDVELVAVSIGPGSFTGLRVGAVCAKTFAWATGAALVAVDTFAAIAAGAPAEVDQLFVIGDAQRGDLYVGEYRRDGAGDFARQGEIRIIPGESWCLSRSATDTISGSGIEAYDDLLAGRCRLLSPEHREPRASAVAALGERKLIAGQTNDPFTLEPFYLRKSAAEEKWESRP
jgi:tRNA threonylcarbamoyladenosine biosynthesis protein TsaB